MIPVVTYYAESRATAGMGDDLLAIVYYVKVKCVQNST